MGLAATRGRRPRYLVERCTGASCSNFAQIGTRLRRSTSQGYVGCRANNHLRLPRCVPRTQGATWAPYSNVATTTTGFSVSAEQPPSSRSRERSNTRPRAPGAATSPGSSTAWQVAVRAFVGMITSGGVYTPPSIAGTHTISATAGTATASVTVYVSNDAGTFTFHNDNMRDGENLNETVLTPANVNSTSFREVCSATRSTGLDVRITAVRPEREHPRFRVFTTS